MATRRRLYIDSEGVKRGYYVYVHKDLRTGEVFYVGKGAGRRAWETDGRNEKWQEKVAALSDGWDVEIIREDLSELEAFDLEGALVKQHGGCAANGGTLTNLIPGGEDPVSIRLGMAFNDGGWSAAYYDARRFKEFSRREQEARVRELSTNLDALMNLLQSLELVAQDTSDEKLADNIVDLDCILGSLRDSCSDFLRRRVSWKDVALAVEETVDDLEMESEGFAKYHNDVRPLLQQSRNLIAEFLSGIDSGNRAKAEKAANRVTGKK